MRINRDIRFSKDKSPYKDHLDLWFWTGDRKGWDSSGFFFRLEADRLLLGAGMHRFEADALARYRAAVLDERKGAALAATIAKIRKAGYEVGTESYKKVPSGVPADHPRSPLLRHGGLHAGWEGKPPAVLEKSAFVDFVAKHFAAVAPRAPLAPYVVIGTRRLRRSSAHKSIGIAIRRSAPGHLMSW